MDKELNKRQKQTIKFVEKYYLKNKFPPTVRDIQLAVQAKSTSTVFEDINKLCKAGLLVKRHTHILPVFTEEYLTKFTEACRK